VSAWRAGARRAGLGGAEPAGLGAGLEDAGVEGDPVDDRGDEAGVGEDGAPFAEWQVCPDRDGGSFVPPGDDLEQQLGAAGVDLDVAGFAGEKEVQAAVAADDAGQCPLVGGFDEFAVQGGGSNVPDPAALLAGGQAQADQQVVLPVPLSPSSTTGSPLSR
jgi:hypothetical protein